MTGVAWLLVAGFALWAVFRLFGLERGSPLVAIIAFTPYVGAGSIVALLFAVAVRRWAAAVAAAAVVVIFALMIVPRAIGGGGADVDRPVALRVLTANMKLGAGDPAALADLAAEKDADVLSVQELTPELARRLRRELGPRLPHRVYVPLPGSAGSGLYSELEPIGPSAPELPGGFPMARAFFEVERGPRIEIFDVHTAPPTTSRSTDIWADDLRALPSAGSGHTLQILAGDFNATLDHAELRNLIGRGYVDAADASGAGLIPTWPEQRDTIPPFVTIDHVLADERIGVGEVSVHEIPGSDHRAVFAELLLAR